MNKYKVYGGMIMVNGKQVRVVIATTSAQKAAHAAKTTVGYVRDYWSVTGNEAEINAAMATPETLIISPE